MDIEEFKLLRDSSVGHNLIKAARLYNEFAMNTVKTQLGVEGLKPSHFQCFPHIPFEGISIVELAQKMSVSKQAVSQLVNELIHLKVLLKSNNPVDRRSVLVTFNTKGNLNIMEGMKSLKVLDSQIESVLGLNSTKKFNKQLQDIILRFGV
jgi:DNA-binding MarR family transcriptional regulator